MKRRGNNEGSIYKNSKGYWIAQLQIGTRDGGIKRKKVQRKTQPEAVLALEEMKRQIYDGCLIDKNTVGFNEWVQEFLDNYCKLRIKQTTYDKYESLARTHIYPRFKAFALQDVKTNHIQKLISDKSTTLSPTTIREIRLVISQALKQAVIEKHVTENAALNTSLPRMVEKEVQPLSEEELSKLLAAAESHRLYHTLMLLVGTGMRRGELLGIQWNDIDFDRRTLRIVRSFVKTKVGNILQTPKTNNSKRVVNLPQSIASLLQEATSKAPADNPWIAYLSDGNSDYPVAPRNYSRLYESWCEKAGISNVRIHSLRHTYASLALSLNIPMKAVQAQLGHADIKTTMNRYSHLSYALQQEAADKIDEKLLHLS